MYAAGRRLDTQIVVNVMAHESARIFAETFYEYTGWPVFIWKCELLELRLGFNDSVGDRNLV